jgi:hypothetical protein
VEPKPDTAWVGGEERLNGLPEDGAVAAGPVRRDVSGGPSMPASTGSSPSTGSRASTGGYALVVEVLRAVVGMEAPLIVKAKPSTIALITGSR